MALVMGVVSPFWMKAIDPAVAAVNKKPVNAKIEIQKPLNVSENRQ